MNYWKYHDSKMVELRNLYKKMSEKTKIRLQEYFKLFKLNSTNIYNIANFKDKRIVNVIIDDWKEKKLLKGYFGVLAKNIYNKSKVKYCEILELLIYGALEEEKGNLIEKENKIIYEDLNYYYQEGQKEVNKELNNNDVIYVLEDTLFYAMLNENNSYGSNVNEYKENLINTFKDKIYRQAIIDIQQQKELNFENEQFITLIDKFIDNKIKIKDNSIFGGIDTQIVELINKAKLNGIRKLDEDAKVRFIAVHDDETTKMCSSLDNQIFNINNWNEFERFSKQNGRITKYRCYGLIGGLNLPPIDDGFHWCRSTITYSTKEDNDDEYSFEKLDIHNFVEKDLSNDKERLITRAFKNKKIRNIALNNYVKKIILYGKKSKHKKGTIYLSVKWKYASDEYKERVLRHEIGHAVDYGNNYFSNNYDFINAIKIDANNLLNNKDYVKKIINDKKYVNYAEISDIISGMTKNKIMGHYFHKNDYWEKKDKVQHETFANLFAIAGSNDMECLKLANNLFPETLKVFDNLLRSVM